jgi:hypothetical protein
VRIKWSRVGVPLCRLDRHTPIRHRVRWDGRYYAGECRYCGMQILRTDHGMWRSGFLHPLVL